MNETIERNIITIDEEKCTGCGACEIGCPEGALKVIDGKARLVGEVLCDGLGACIGTCPEGAITVERRLAEPYDEAKVMDNVVPQGPNVIKAHLEHLKSHGQHEYLDIALRYLKDHKVMIPSLDARAPAPGCQGGGSGGCPGSRTVSLERDDDAPGEAGVLADAAPRPELRNWPVQLKLVNPAASYFDNARLLIAADCVPFAHANFHAGFLKGKVLVMFCPKLDGDPDGYVQKLAAIFSLHDIHSIDLVHMQVPCCFGSKAIVEDALRRAGKIIPVAEHVITIQGGIA